MDSILQKKLAETKDEFLPAQSYITKWGYKVDETGTIRDVVLVEVALCAVRGRHATAQQPSAQTQASAPPRDRR